MATSDTPVGLDIVVPVYNERDAIGLFHSQLQDAIGGLPAHVRVLYVNDGSSDDTAHILSAIALQDSRVIIIELSRNFGHQAALTAGLDAADADVVVMMDGDGQHPPQLIPQMLGLYRSGYDIVLTQRVNDSRLSPLKRETSHLFYWLLNTIGNTAILPGAADYRLMSRQAVNALKSMPEYHRFLRGMTAWIGYRTVVLPYQAPDRLAGKSKYSIRKMLRLAGDAMFSFSLIPLQLGVSLGLVFLLAAMVEGLYVAAFWLRGQQGQLVPGWSSLMFMLLLIGGALLITLGLIGIYVGYIYQEVKRRPVYLVRKSEARERRPAASDESESWP